MASHLRLWSQLLLVLLAQAAVASLRNFTINDTDPSVHYSPNWSTECPLNKSQCPDLKEAHSGTFHWAWPASPGNITIRFSGTAINVYNVLTNIPAKIVFTLDGSPVAPYHWSGGSGVGLKYFYHQLVYANDNLSNGGHNLVIGGEGLIIFDYVNLTSSNGPPPTVPPSTSPPPPLPPPSARPMSLSSPTSQEVSTTLTVTTSRVYTLTMMFSPSDTPISTAADVPTPTATPSSKEGSNRSAGAIAGAIVGSVFALILLVAITLFVRRRLPFYWNERRMRRLLDEDPPPQMNNVDHSPYNRGQFLHPMYPALRPTPDVPRSPGYTMSSIPTSPTSYGGEPPSRTFLNDGTVARILEKADRAHHEWPSSGGTKSFPAVFGTVERW